MTTTAPINASTPTTTRERAGSSLRTALRANAGFSLSTGLLLTVVPASVAGWLGVETEGWLRALGVALLAHAAVLAVVARLDDPRPLGRVNLLAIAPYPLLLAATVVVGWVDRPLGVALLAVDGIVVGMIAVLHVLGLRDA